MHIPRIVARKHLSAEIPFDDIIFKKADLIRGNARVSRFDISNHIGTAKTSFRDGKRRENQFYERLFRNLLSGRKKIRNFIFAENCIQNALVGNGISDDHGDLSVSYATADRAANILCNRLRFKKGVGGAYDTDIAILDFGRRGRASALVNIFGKEPKCFTPISVRFPKNGFFDPRCTRCLCRSADPSFRFCKHGDRRLTSVLLYEGKGHRYVIRTSENILQYIVLLHGKR